MNNRRRLTGVVTGNKMEKTVVVEVSRSFRHLLYQKVVHTAKRFKVHDELGCQVGDKVQIIETKPISKTKRFSVEKIIKKDDETEILTDIEVTEEVQQ
jgi:small subunit ribosomal protein S17